MKRQLFQNIITETERKEKTIKLLNNMKRDIWQSINKPLNLDEIFPSEVKSIKKSMNNAFMEHISTSILMIGAPDSGLNIILDSILAEYDELITKKNGAYTAGCVNGSYNTLSIAKVNGYINSLDSDAIKSLADQFLIRSSTDNRHFNLAIEDLELHFRQCRINKIPAIVILEEIDLFAERDKQVLIYTLLDLMHKRDLLFIVIGLTSCANIRLLLEKRIISRLNASFVYMSSCKLENLVKLLVGRLVEPLLDLLTNAASAENSVGTDDDDDVYIDDKTISRIEYIKLFIDKILDIFGEGGNEILVTKYRAFCTNSEEFRVTNSQNSSSNKVPKIKDVNWGNSKSNKGTIRTLLTNYIDWGYTYNFFVNITSTVCSKLSYQLPYFTNEMFEKVLVNSHPLTLKEVLSWLSVIDLTTLIAVYRLTVYQDNKYDITINNIMVEYNKLTTHGLNTTSNTSVTHADVTPNDLIKSVLILESLQLLHVVNSKRTVTSGSIVQLLCPLDEFKQVFLPEISSQYSHLERSQPFIQIKEKLKRAIKYPEISDIKD